MARRSSQVFFLFVVSSAGCADVAESPERVATDVPALVDDYLYREVTPDDRYDTLRAIDDLPPEQAREFQVLLAELSGANGFTRELQQAVVDVAIEHGVSPLGLAPELMEHALRRGFRQFNDAWGPERVEWAVQSWMSNLRLASSPAR